MQGHRPPAAPSPLMEALLYEQTMGDLILDEQTLVEQTMGERTPDDQTVVDHTLEPQDFVGQTLEQQTLDERTLRSLDSVTEPMRDPQHPVMEWLANVESDDELDAADAICGSIDSLPTDRPATRPSNNSFPTTLPSGQQERPRSTTERVYDTSSDFETGTSESSDVASKQDHNKAQPMRGQDDGEAFHPTDRYEQTSESIHDSDSNKENADIMRPINAHEVTSEAIHKSDTNTSSEDSPEPIRRTTGIQSNRPHNHTWRMLGSNDNRIRSVADGVKVLHAQRAIEKQPGRQSMSNNYIDLVTALRHGVKPNHVDTAQKPSPPPSPPKFILPPVGLKHRRRRHPTLGTGEVADPFVTAQSSSSQGGSGSSTVSESTGTSVQEKTRDSDQLAMGLVRQATPSASTSQHVDISNNMQRLRINGGKGLQDVTGSGPHPIQANSSPPGLQNPVSSGFFNFPGQALHRPSPPVGESITSQRLAIFGEIADIEKEKEKVRQEKEESIQAWAHSTVYVGRATELAEMKLRDLDRRLQYLQQKLSQLPLED